MSDKTPMVLAAIALARIAHAGQKDKHGLPYFDHLERVAERTQFKAVAYLHDILEDTVATAESLRNLGFPEDIIADVEILTRRSEETYAAFIERVGASKSEVAITVKLADLEDHLESDCPKSLAPRYQRAQIALRRFYFERPQPCP